MDAHEPAVDQLRASLQPSTARAGGGSSGAVGDAADLSADGGTGGGTGGTNYNADTNVDAEPDANSADRPPWCGAPGREPLAGWIAALSYDLGRRLEPAADGGSAANDRQWPDLLLARVTSGFAYDHDNRRWWTLGSPDPELVDVLHGPPVAARPYTIDLDGMTPSLDDADHAAAVAETRAAIARGDFFQANITRRWTADFTGDLRAVAAAAMRAARPRYGALLEGPDGRGLVSMSPELFLEIDARRQRILSRPIKGTRPAAAGEDASADVARELLASEKDAAELVMIIDLMRNDLGRICEPGTVRVDRPRHVETHETVHHGVADVTGRLRADVDVAGVLAATFPPGSVTGAPKIQAMRHIDGIEPVRRGAYCGAIGWIGDDGAVQLNVAIRTIAVTRESGAASQTTPRMRLDYGAGGGIVADSDPWDEVQESDDKTAVLRRVATRAADPSSAAPADVSPRP